MHESHGLGVYKGIEKIQVEGVEKDYIKIAYANNGNLYVLATQLDRLQKYANQDTEKSLSLTVLVVLSGRRQKPRLQGQLRKWLKSL